MRMLNRNPKRLSAEVFFSAQKQPKQNASSQKSEENGSTTLRNTREKPLLAGYSLGRVRLARFARIRLLRHALPISLPILKKKTTFAVYSVR